MEASIWIRNNCRFAANEIWRMKADDYILSQFPGLDFAQIINDHTSEYVAARHRWDSAMKRALSFGQISLEDARKLRFTEMNYDEKIASLPLVLYHVTTSKSGVERNGLKSRRELNQNFGGGLGGGTSDTISFTEDLDIAKAIKQALLDGRKVARGDISVQDMIEIAKKGEGAKQPWIGPWFDYYFNMERTDKRGSIPKEIQTVIDGIEVENSMPDTAERYNQMRADRGSGTSGWEPHGERWPHGDADTEAYTTWKRKLNPTELRAKWFGLYKSFMFFRERAGGPLDPLFFSSDEGYLANVPEDQIAILAFKPKPNAKGFQVSSLGEWRTWAGDTVEFIGEVG